jgi:hypothetical protein
VRGQESKALAVFVLILFAISIVFSINAQSIKAATPPPFHLRHYVISASPPNQEVTIGELTTFVVSLTLLNADLGGAEVALSVEGFPENVSISFIPGIVFLKDTSNSTINSTLFVDIKDSAPTGTYPLTINGVYGTEKSSTNVTLTIVPTQLTSSVFAQIQNVETGQSATFQASASGGETPYSYQWFEGTNPLTGETLDRLQITKEETGPYTFYCRVTDSKGTSADSNIVTLAVTTPPTPLPGTTQPGNSTSSITQPFATQNTGSSLSIWIYPILAVGITIFAFIAAWRVIIARKKFFRFIIGVLPMGWQFYDGLTAAEPPGTVFRISPEGEKQIVDTIKSGLQINEYNEATPKLTQEGTIETFVGFTGLKTIDLTGKAKGVQNLVLEMVGLKRESTTDVNMDPLVEKLLNRDAIYYRPTHSYFIIRNTRKATEINYKLTQNQVERLGGENSLSNMNIEGKILTYSKETHTLSQKFDVPMRVMFNAEKIKIKEVNGKLKITSYRRVKKLPNL